MTHPEILFDCYEYRTGVYLVKAYVVGRNEAGRLVHVHHAAKATGLGQFGIELTQPLARALQLVDTLKPAAVAAAFRRGNQRAATLPGLLSQKHKLRPEVIRHVQHRVAGVLTLCQANNWPVTINLKVRGAPEEFVTPFATAAPTPRFHYSLTDRGCTYRLEIEREGGAAWPVREYDWKVITNQPKPGWLVMNGRLVQLGRLAGNHIKAFLLRTEVQIPREEFGEFFRRSVVPAARFHRLNVEGFGYREIGRPDGLRLSTKWHPFEHRYLIYPEVVYGTKVFALGDPEATAIEYATQPTYRLTRVVRDFGTEAELALLLTQYPLHPLPSTTAYALPDEDDRFAALRWLRAHQKELEERGVEVTPPDVEGKIVSQLTADIVLEANELEDWLDLHGTVTVGEFRIAFSKFVRYIQREERCFPLPDGTLFLIPEEWFAKYQPALRFAQTEGKRVRVTKAHAPLLTPLGIAPSDTAGLQESASFTPSKQLRATLRPYQLAGARWLVKHYHQGLGACLADDMGLGKTLQTITALLYAKEQQKPTPPGESANGAAQMDFFAPPADDEDFLQPLRALIVLPASLIHNWRAELRKFAPTLTVRDHTGAKRHKDARALRRFDVTLTTYQTALRDASLLRQIAFTYVVLDESQQIKNRQSKVFKALNSLHATHRISLSGTPIENSLSDLWSQMQFINPGLLKGYTFFKREFIEPIERDDDQGRKEELRRLVSPHLLRRTKVEVAPDLPDLETQLYYCEMTTAQRKAYDRELSAARNALLGHGAEEEGGKYRLRVIQTLTRLRQLANHPRLLDGASAADSGKFIEVLHQWSTVRRSGRKVLIFSSMVSHLELFREELRKSNEPFAWITGAVPADARAREVDRFQTDPDVLTFFISIKAGGTGLNLTAADYVFILDPWWNPSVEDQAIARAHRIGRTGNVFARKYISRGTIEEKIIRLQHRKKQLAGDILGGEAKLTFDRSELNFLLTPE